MSKKTKSSRREFIKQSLSTVALASIGGCVTPAKTERSPASLDENEFDYIVIGSGAGGGPVACNLAQAGFRVLLLEAGDAQATRNYDVPAFQGLSTEDEKLSWSFFVNHYTQPDRQRRDSKFVPGQGILYPRAGTVGGCTAHNAMITLYPDHQDWDDIAQLTGDNSWRHQEMRKYFQRVEKVGYTKPRHGNPQQHGLNGWLTTEQSNPKFLFQEPKFARIATAAAAELGSANLINEVLHDRNTLIDPNNMNYVNSKRDGIFNTPKATLRGHRNGTREHIMRTMQRYPSNLILRTNSLANRILLDPSNTRAIGVEYQEGARLYKAHANPSDSGGSTRQVYAKKEVILSGGAFNSPQLLMLSGIGPKEELDRHGIPVRVNLPGVGKNLQDRYEVGVTTQLNSEIELLKGCTFGDAGDPCLDRYDRNPNGSLYSSNGVLLSIYKRSNSEKPTPDLAIFAVPGKFTGYFPGWSRDATRKDYFTWAILKGHTHNTSGTVTLKSNDPRDTPEINFRYFDEGNDSTEDDLNGMISGIETVKRINSRHLVRSISKSTSLDQMSQEQIRQYVKDNAWGHHASCTNKMGPASDPLAVVDSKFRVHGVDGLRVVDASVFPKIPGLFIVVPIYMIAEKASEDILSKTL